jgi:prepilin-type N-terminal cleavage/methylation domain-containing protein
MYSDKRRSAEPRRRRRRRDAGFSLVESLVAAAILGIGALGMTAGAVELSRAAKIADMTGAATALATARMEVLRSMPLGAPGHATGSYSAGTMQANGTANGPYTVSWVVSAKDQPTWGLKTVTVTTSWTQYSSTSAYNAAHSVRVAGLIRCSSAPCP